MKPYGVRYWQADRTYVRDPILVNGRAQTTHLQQFTVQQYLEEYGGSAQACSWLRDQEYLVDINYHKNISYLHITPKIRLEKRFLANSLSGYFDVGIMLETE